MTDFAIQVKQLTRCFGDFMAVDHIDLELPAGRISGFLGPNGSGKSTTIRMLCGLLTPTAGEVQVLGYQIPRDAEKLRWKIGYMTQRFSLYEDLSTQENLNFMASVYGLHGKAKKRQIDKAIDSYDLRDLLRQRAGTMSGGQKQRLALAATTLHQPEILLLDEPTSAVDPQSRRDFWEQLFALADAGTTILVSTHYMDEAERCHKLIFLHRGRIVAEGTPPKLIQNINARVLEIDSDQLVAVKEQLGAVTGIHSVTQLGSRLHLLVDQSREGIQGQIEAQLNQASIEAHVQAVTASLEDVFVASTQETVSAT